MFIKYHTPQSQIDFLIETIANKDLTLFGRPVGSTARVHMAVSLHKLQAFKLVSTTR